MKKVLDLLEQHVQWIAIGLGALFVLFMTWTYVLQPPASVDVGGEKLTAGEIDPKTYETVGKQIEAAMNDNARINIPVPSYVQGFKDTMAWKEAKPIEVAGAWNSPTSEITVEQPQQP